MPAVIFSHALILNKSPNLWMDTIYNFGGYLLRQYRIAEEITLLICEVRELYIRAPLLLPGMSMLYFRTGLLYHKFCSADNWMDSA